MFLDLGDLHLNYHVGRLLSLGYLTKHLDGAQCSFFPEATESTSCNTQGDHPQDRTSPAGRLWDRTKRLATGISQIVGRQEVLCLAQIFPRPLGLTPSDGLYQCDGIKQDHLVFAFLPWFLEIATGTKKVVFTGASIKVILCHIF